MEYSFQLYCARNFPPVIGMLPRLRELGYSQVEGFGGLYADNPDLPQALKDSGLAMPTGHFGLDDLEKTDETLKRAESLGIKMLFCPAVPPAQRSQNEDGWKQLSETLARLNEVYTGAGYRFGWHNHAFEFAATDSGKMPLELILDGAPDIVWEHDIAWTIRGGHDPVRWIDRYADRIVAIHVKDLAPDGEATDEDGWADVGQGTIDWVTMMRTVRQKTACQYFVMEHDNPSDVERFARRSIEFVRSLES